MLLEGHGREPLAGFGASRAVGWFTSLFPVTLDLGASAELGDQIQSVQATLRRVPGRGFGYGLHALAEEFAAPRPAIAFNYLGRFGDDLAGGPFRLAEEPIGPAIDPDAPLLQELELVAVEVEGHLRVQLWASPERFPEPVLARLAAACRAAMEAIVRHTLNRPPCALTVAEIDYDGFAPAELAEFLESL